MQYKIVPFNASIKRDETSQAAASQLEIIVLAAAAEGWEYVRMESIPTYVAGSAGCFGFGAIAPSSRNYPVVVFRK